MPYVSHADIGGRSGFGPVVPEPEGAVFRATWEPRAHALTIALGATGSWNLDMARSARETLPDYLNLSYYEIWLGGLEKLVIAKNLATPDELTAGCALHAPAPVGRVLKADRVAAVLAKGAPTERAPAGPARFRPGQRVRTRRTPTTPIFLAHRKARLTVERSTHISLATVFWEAQARPVFLFWCR